ncbi:MAG TPA: sigma-E factor regulatory protein RseB domain-containing protein [Mycobacteriales bacterium]|nr:sigma-E factor regulatory protein RseB domain-containing protein [Mycobacteriales bacterium]
MRTVPRRRARWLVPILAAALVALATAIPDLAAGSPAPRLPGVTPLQLLGALGHVDFPGVVGEAELTVNLGLPDLPDGALGSSPLLGLLGSHPVQVWIAADGRFRLAVLGRLQEQDIVDDGHLVWIYNSVDNSVIRIPLFAARSPARANRSGRPGIGIGVLLAAAAADTASGVGPPVRIAGRPCYQLVLAPRSPDTLLRSLRLAIDPQSDLPLRLQLFGRSSTPAVELTFTSIRVAAPPVALLSFTPPPGVGTGQLLTTARSGTPTSTQIRLGDGWDAVAVLDHFPLNGGSAALITELGSRTQTGVLLTTSLLSVLLTRSGRLIAGPVPPDRLANVAGSP